MASIIPGYEYDIFISYRQKDNKHDGWVSKFVDNLKGELEATFKEDVSVYFDENPHDRLQETHNVDKSLEGKLKCLIFIPILSQTYCDPKSYAWQYEFLPFLRMAEADQFGRDVKLRSGNVASRILPIRIHDLEPEDIKLFEKETSSILRAMDFVFKTSSGVNRPLKANEDHPQDNLNKTFYGDQINKVGHAIKEIILGMKAKPFTFASEKTQQRQTINKENKAETRIENEKPTTLQKRNWIAWITIIVILIISTIFFYPKVFKGDRLEYIRSKGKISISVFPFFNSTNDAIWDAFQSIIQDNLIASLSVSDEFSVRNIESVNNIMQGEKITNFASFTPSLASSISKKLDTDVYIYGNIGQIGSTIRINAQLIDTKSKEIFKSFQIELYSEKEFSYKIIDSLSTDIENFLVISQLKKKIIPDEQLPLVSTIFPEAYSNYKYGKDAFAKGDWNESGKYLNEAVKIDSNFTFASILLTWTYLNRGMYDEAKNCLQKAYRKKNQIPSMHIKIKLEDMHALITEGPEGRIKWLKQLPNYDTQDPHNYSDLGNTYNLLERYYDAIPVLKKALEIYNNWNVKPFYVWQYNWLGLAYHETGQYIREKKLYRKAEKDFPDNPNLIYRQAILAVSDGKTDAEHNYIDKYKSILKANSTSDADIATNLGWLYWEAGAPEKAEEYLRQALSLETENPFRMNNFAYFLIDSEGNINEAMELVDKALVLSPNNYEVLDSKGWAQYKQGKYQEALNMLQKSWDLRMKNAVYNHPAFLHLEAAKKALAMYK